MNIKEITAHFKGRYSLIGLILFCPFANSKQHYTLNAQGPYKMTKNKTPLVTCKLEQLLQSGHKKDGCSISKSQGENQDTTNVGTTRT